MKIKLIKFKRLKSTNDEAHRYIKNDELQPSIIISKKQTKGRGTMGKKWVSKEGNLFLSIFFEFNPKRINFKQYAILNAHIIKKILTKYIFKNINIKWPNDLMIENKKICGILQEVINYKKRNFIIIGIGINTLLAPNITSLKTSALKHFSKKKVDNNKILKDIKKTYEKFILDSERYNFSTLKKKIR